MFQPDKKDEGKVAERYKQLSATREPFLRRARECAAVTIPSLLPRYDDVSGQKLPTPYQSVGAAGVNNLAAKLLLALFPPNGRFFRLIITSFDIDAMVQRTAVRQAQETGGDPLEIALAMREEVEAEAQENLAKVERAVVQEYESNGNRATDFEAFKHLVALGNVLRYHPLTKKDKPRIYALNQYVVRRDPDGTVLEIITKEGVAPSTIDKAVREACKIPPEEDPECRRFYELYTRIVRTENKRGTKHWEEYQELNGIEIPGSQGNYKIDRCPWLPLRWSKVDGEDYGRGHGEDYLGELISLNGLRQAIVEGSVAAARVIQLVNPAGVTRARDIAEAKNGTIISGDPKDVAFLRVEKANDFAVAANASTEIKRDLGQAFLMTTSIQRNGERVTAEEVRRLANELEQGLGGNYSTLALEYQLPLVELTMFSMQRQKRLPDLPPEVKPTILTGIQALGRNADLEREMMFYQAMGGIPIPPEEKAIALEPSVAIRRLATHLDIDVRGLVRTPEKIEEIKKQQQEAMMAQAVAPQMIQAAAGAANQPPPEQEM